MKKNKKDKLPTPTYDIWDVLHQSTKAALSVIPPLATFYEMVIAPPFQKRTIEWMQTVAVACSDFEKRFDEFKPENLVNNELFQSAFNHSARIAVQTHQTEKLETLRYALLNTVIMKDLNENYKILFLKHIEDLTVLHIKIFKFLDSWGENDFEPVEGTIGQADPFFHKYRDEIDIDYDLFEKICYDLERMGLADNKRKTFDNDNDNNFHISFWYLTEHGTKLLKFITIPENSHKKGK